MNKLALSTNINTCTYYVYMQISLKWTDMIQTKWWLVDLVIHATDKFLIP